MQHRLLTVMTMLAVAAGPAAAQAGKAAPKAFPNKPGANKAAAKKPAVPHTPWGDPDLQGVWNDATSTPLQRPGGVAGKGVLSDEEAAEFQDQLASDLSRDRRDGGSDADVNRAYNEHWMDSRRLKITSDHRTSLIVDPPDGRMPSPVPLSAEPRKLVARVPPPMRASTPGCLPRTPTCRCRCDASFAPIRRLICLPSTTTISRFSKVPATL